MWTPPSRDYLPDFRELGKFLDYGESDLLVVPVSMIVGSAANPEAWKPDWTLREGAFSSRPDLLKYHEGKLGHLMNGWPERGLPPITKAILLADQNPDIDLCMLGKLYFVNSGGEHRVAVAHRNRFKRLRATVTYAWLKVPVPSAAAWLASLDPSDQPVV